MLGPKVPQLRRLRSALGGEASPRSPGGSGAPLALPEDVDERLELLQARAEEWRPRRWVLRREVGRGGSGFVAGRKRPGGLGGGAPHPPPGLRLRASAACVWSILLGAFPTSWAPWLRAALHPKSLRT